MAIPVFNRGTVAGDGNGDTLRTTGNKLQQLTTDTTNMAALLTQVSPVDNTANRGVTTNHFNAAGFLGLGVQIIMINESGVSLAPEELVAGALLDVGVIASGSLGSPVGFTLTGTFKNSNGKTVNNGEGFWAVRTAL